MNDEFEKWLVSEIADHISGQAMSMAESIQGAATLRVVLRRYQSMKKSASMPPVEVKVVGVMKMQVIEYGEVKEREVERVEMLEEPFTGEHHRTFVRPVLLDGEEAIYSVGSMVPTIVRVRDP